MAIKKDFRAINLGDSIRWSSEDKNCGTVEAFTRDDDGKPAVLVRENSETVEGKILLVSEQNYLFTVV